MSTFSISCMCVCIISTAFMISIIIMNAHNYCWICCQCLKKYILYCDDSADVEEVS